MKLIIAFRRELVCDISHLDILPNGVYFETKMSELNQISAEYDTITITSLFPTELAVLNIDTAVMDTPRIVNSAIRVQLVSQIK